MPTSGPLFAALFATSALLPAGLPSVLKMDNTNAR
jgi:hypothetical protein